jgi:hypothetical protein
MARAAGSATLRPIGVRIGAAIIALMFSSLFVFFLVAFTPYPWGLLALGLGVVFITLAVARGFRIELTFDAESVTIKNYWRTYRLRWDEIKEIGTWVQEFGMGWAPAVAFVPFDGPLVTSQATVSRRLRRQFMEGLRAEAKTRGIAFTVPESMFSR